MTDPVGMLHPRKLNAMLRACTTADSRARAALEFLRASTGAEAGFLFYSRQGAVVLAAAGRDRQPPPGLLDEAKRVLASARDLQSDDKATRDVGKILALPHTAPITAWQAPSGESYEHRVLSNHQAPVAIVFLLGSKPPAPVRHAHVEAICDVLISSGDCAPLA